MKASQPGNEAGRLATLRRYQLLDTPPEDVFDDLTELAAHICEAPIALITLIDEKRQWFKSAVGMRRREIARDISFCGSTLKQRDVVIVADALKDKRFAGNPLVTAKPHVRFYAGMPLVTPEGHALGTLCVFDRVPRTLRPHQRQALRVLSHHVAAQFELQRLQADIERRVHERTAQDTTARKLEYSLKRQRSLSHRLVDVLDTEQRRLSGELHDRIGQNLAALSVNLKILDGKISQEQNPAIAARLQDSQTLLETTIASVRDLVTELRPVVLDDYGLLAGLRWYGEQVQTRTGLQIRVAGQEPVPRLEPAVERGLFRIAQEALTNTVKHAQAQRVDLQLRRDADRIVLTIADDGVGFDPDSFDHSGPHAHWGQELMRERAEAVGGRLRVDSAPGRGTLVEIEVTRPS